MAGSGFDAVLIGLGAIPGAWLRLRFVNHLEPMVPIPLYGVNKTFQMELVVRLTR